jgi:DNA-binding transcriptional ArsR family regulator
MDSPALFRLLGDEVRLRILRLLAAERLNVSELTGILGIAQSGVSRHLGLLKEAKLVEERREGTFTFFRIAPSLVSGENGFGGLWPVLTRVFESAAATAAGKADEVRLEEVRRVRKENFEEHADPVSQGRQLVPGRSWAAWARALAHLMPRLVVADIGCGEGYLTVEAARFAERVIAIDRSAPMLQRGRELARRRRVSNIQWKRGALEALPLQDATIDLALLSQALHHAMIRRGRSGKPSASSNPGVASSCSIFAATISSGSATRLAIAGSGSKNQNSSGCCRRPDSNRSA